MTISFPIAPLRQGGSLALLVSSFLIACLGENDASGGGGSGGAGGGTQYDCMPSEAEYDANIRSILDLRCSQCHGEQPDNGAPFSLLDYETVMSTFGSGRVIDHVVARLSDGTMPPAGQPRPTQAEFDTLVDWASCGTADPPYTPGLLASQPVFASPSEAPEGLDEIEMTAGGSVVAVGTTDEYRSFTFSNIVAEEGFISRFEVILDQSEVVHHITLHYANADDHRYLYAWAPGTGPVQFPEGGLRVRPSDAFRVEIHYNNYSTDKEYVDSSGIRVFVGPATGTEYAMADPCTFSINVQPQSEGTAVAQTTALTDFRVLAGMPHMHQIGSKFLHEITRLDGSVETLIELSNWSFETQFFYSLPIEVKAGEGMTITCTYQNPSADTVVGGPGTGDEMCYNFMYITPPGGLPACLPF